MKTPNLSALQQALATRIALMEQERILMLADNVQLRKQVAALMQERDSAVTDLLALRSVITSAGQTNFPPHRPGRTAGDRPETRRTPH